MLVVQSCLTLCDPLDCSPPGSSVHGILHATILKWVAIPVVWPGEYSLSGCKELDTTEQLSLSLLYHLSHLGSPRLFLVYDYNKQGLS